jgi:hypothetical protein
MKEAKGPKPWRGMMAALTLRAVNAWIDDLAPRDGAFAEAVDWAGRLRVPLRTISECVTLGAHERCLTACNAKGVLYQEAEGMDQLFQPQALAVFGNYLGGRRMERLLHMAMHSRRGAVLVCPPTVHPVSRVLVLHDDVDSHTGFLDGAARLCRTLGAAPVVLTVARTAAVACRRQENAEQILARYRLAAHFDFIVGSDVRAAVISVARWRRCEHVFLAQRRAGPWWRWLRGDTLMSLLGLTDSLTFLALPEEHSHLVAPAEEGPTEMADAAAP